MHKLEELKDNLCERLEEYSSEELTTSSLDVIDKLAHTIKNLDKIIDKYYGEDEYSNGYSRNSYANRYSRNSYDEGGSYARSGMGSGNSYARGRGRNARRDSMGRYASDSGYSRDGEMLSELRSLMEEAPDDKTRQDIQKIVQRMEQNM